MNNVQTETARKVPLFVRTPFIEMEGLFTDDVLNQGGEHSLHHNKIEIDPEMMKTMFLTVDFWPSVDHAENLPSPRVIKSHLPIEMLPPTLLDTCKVIFVCRTPKDCCVSFYNHFMNFPEYKFKGEFADYAELFLEGTVEFGSYWTMLKVQIFSTLQFCNTIFFSNTLK